MVHIKGRPSKKIRLFEEALRVVAEGGVQALTIEALAEAAGITKGGVQYHFDSKDTLYRELLDFALEHFDQELEARAPIGSKPGAWLHAYVDLSLGDVGDHDNAVAALLAGIPVEDPRGEPFRRYAAKWKRRAADDGGDTATSTVVRLAADSLWIERLVLGATAAEVARVKTYLHQLIERGQQK